MYGQTHARLFRDRHNRAQEVRHVFAQLIFINAAVLCQTGAELIQRVALFCTRQARDDIAGQLLYVCFTCCVKPFARLLLLVGRVIGFRARAFQNV